MQLDQLPQSVFRPVPPPLWHVTNGELTVGPVVTGLLLRGIECGRIPDYCSVRPSRGDWRNLYSVREVAALGSSRAKTSTADQLKAWAQPLRRIKDEEELGHTVTWLSLIATDAESAMFHFRQRGSRTLVTRSIAGPISKEQMGYALAEDDLVLQAARLGRPVTGPPYGPTEDALAMRFAGSWGGVGAAAMIPVFAGGTLAAMLELSRPGHAFRRSDLQRAERIVHQALRLRAN